MSITKKPSPVTIPSSAAALEKFVQAAPDAAGRLPEGKERMKQISLTLSPEDITAIDAAAKRQRMSRAAFIRSRVMAGIEV